MLFGLKGLQDTGLKSESVNVVFFGSSFNVVNTKH